MKDRHPALDPLKKKKAENSLFATPECTLRAREAWGVYTLEARLTVDSLGRLRPLDSRETNRLIPLQKLNLLQDKSLLYYRPRLATQPQGDLEGEGLLDLPPLGWSTGFIAMPLTRGRRPSLRDAPPEERTSSLWSRIERPPRRQRPPELTLLVRPEGRLSIANLLQLVRYSNLEPAPGDLAQ